MVYSENLIAQVRTGLKGISAVEEKPMFKSLCFMVNGKMCVCVGKDELMCRVRPEDYEVNIVKDGCRPMLRKGKVVKGPIFVSESVITSQVDFDYWMNLNLAYNQVVTQAN